MNYLVWYSKTNPINRTLGAKSWYGFATDGRGFLGDTIHGYGNDRKEVLADLKRQRPRATFVQQKEID